MSFKKFSKSNAQALYTLVEEFAPSQGYSIPDAEAFSRLTSDASSGAFPLDIWLYEVKDEIVGYVATYPTYSSFLGKPTLHIEDLFVTEKHRKQGIGRRLLELCYETAQKSGYGRVDLHVFHKNTSALRFYETNGLQPENGWLLYRQTL